MEGRTMSQSVLFDAPGPRTIRRHRVYTVLTVAAIVGVVAFAVYKLTQQDQFEADKWEVFTTPDYLRVILVDGVLDTLKMAAAGIVGALVLGLVLGIGKLSDHEFVRVPCWAVVEFFRAVPVVFLMIFFFSIYGIYHGTTGPFWCVVWALWLYNGAVLAEVFRAGILAVPGGQGEAAYALGMRKGQVVWIVLLPQAVKIMIPAIISQCVVTLKDTSLGLRDRGPRPDRRGPADLPRVPEPRAGLPGHRRHLHRAQPDPDRPRDLRPEEVRGREEGARGPDGRHGRPDHRVTPVSIASLGRHV